jgi:hypothetical protein
MLPASEGNLKFYTSCFVEPKALITMLRGTCLPLVYRLTLFWKR